MLSIIIPTLNEERELPKLLDSIKEQGVEDYQVIVADAGSRDDTQRVARRHDCHVVAGGLPAKGRNEGAKVAAGDILLFLDADVTLRPGVLRTALKEFEDRKIDAATFCLEPQGGKLLTRFLTNLFYNWPIEFCEPFLAHGSMAILVRRAIHERLGGFDEEIRLAEDHEYMRRAKGIGRFGVLRCGPVLISVRRFETDGWLRTYMKYFMAEMYMIVFGAVKSDVFKYRFGHYGNGGK